MRNPLYLLTLILCLGLTACSIFKNASKEKYKPEMVYVEGGTFKMGDIFEHENTDAIPIHKVTLSDFRIGKYEVTFNEYAAFARQTDRPIPDSDTLSNGNRAVTKVTWQEAQTFCEYYGWRLPTEQEWEYAARSGGKKQKYAGTNNSDSLKIYARTNDNSGPYLFTGGSKKPNDLGIYDMSGNAFEWIGAYYQFYPEEGESPKWDNLERRSVRIIRGGSYLEQDHIASTYWRVGTLSNSRSKDLGFRCVDPLK